MRFKKTNSTRTESTSDSSSQKSEAISASAGIVFLKKSTRKEYEKRERKNNRVKWFWETNEKTRQDFQENLKDEMSRFIHAPLVKKLFTSSNPKDQMQAIKQLQDGISSQP